MMFSPELESFIIGKTKRFVYSEHYDVVLEWNEIQNEIFILDHDDEGPSRTSSRTNKSSVGQYALMIFGADTTPWRQAQPPRDLTETSEASLRRA